MFNQLPCFGVYTNWNLAHGCSGLFNQLLWGLIHTYHRKSCVVRSSVYIKNPFHISDEITVLIRGNYPALFPSGLNFVFFKTRRTVS